MKIACLGWGSLIWAPGALKIVGEWQTDGPFLPIEFARTSMDGRLTLVITDGAKAIQTLWVIMSVENLMEAVESLRQRENIGARSAAEFIGRLQANADPANAVEVLIKHWLETKNIDAIVWTNLPPKFDGQNGRIPTEPEAIAHLKNLEADQMALAREYIERTPQQVTTNYRLALQKTYNI